MLILFFVPIIPIAQGRTYYLHCSSRKEADEWCNALRNNVEALPKEEGMYWNVVIVVVLVSLVEGM